MTVKEFFKSKTFLCIVVLLCIALVAGALLSIMNDLLFVSPDERVARTIKSIYGTEIEYETVYDVEAEMQKPEAEQVFYKYDNKDRKGATVELGGHIDNVYRLADGNYLVKATGFQGYKQGSVSVWCVAKFENGAFVGIDNVSVAEYDKQTLMSKFTKGLLSSEAYRGSDAFNHVEGGASYSSDALNNALNAALRYVKSLEGGAQ